MTEAIIYAPKGGMCLTCTKLKMDCSSLPFHEMKVIAKDGRVAFVRCVAHNRAPPSRPASGSVPLADVLMNKGD